MRDSDLIAAGLHDPASADAEDRLALLRWMLDRGITVEQIVARGGLSLSELASDLAVRPGPRLSARQLADRAGMTVDAILSLALTAGLPVSPPDEPAYTEADLTLFAAFSAGAALFGEEPTRRFVRVVGSSLSRIAEAAVALYQFDVARPIRESGGSELTLAKKSVGAVENLDGVRMVLNGLFGAHVETAIRRLREARRPGSPDAPAFAVGFADLVGVTSLTRDMSIHELAGLIVHFEETACDIVAQHDGRVVKLIGDEVMFVTRYPDSACEIALALVERFAGDALVTPRGAVTYGAMLVRGGDYYGPVVNLASRVAQIAAPGELLVTTEVANGVSGSGFVFEDQGQRLLKGFVEPVGLLRTKRRGEQ